MAVNQITLRRIPDGDAGTRTTLKMMAKLAKDGRFSPEVHATARRILQNVPAKNWPAEVEAVYEFVRDSIRYTQDPDGAEGLQTPVVTLEIKAGDCDDKVILLGALLLSLNHPVRFCAVRLDDDPFYSHVFAQTRLGAGWVNLETTEGPIRMGDLGPHGHRIVQPMMVLTL